MKNLDKDRCNMYMKSKDRCRLHRKLC